MGTVKCDFKGKDPKIWGKPWGARLYWTGKEIEFDFSSTQMTGLISEGGTILLQAEPGAPCVFGQKNLQTGKSTKVYAIIGDDFGLNFCDYNEAKQTAMDWYYKYGVGSKLPYRKEEQKKQEEQPAEQQEEKPLKQERLGVYKVRSGFIMFGDPDYLYSKEELGIETKIDLLKKVIANARDNAGSLKSNKFEDVAGFVMTDGDVTTCAEALVSRDEKGEIKEITIKIK